MIKFLSSEKMLRVFLIFSLCFVAIYGSGEFSVLSHHKSISFKGKDPLQSEFVGDVIYTALGNAVAEDAEWAGLIVNDPFNLPKNAIIVLVDGVAHINVGPEVKTFKLEGSSSEQSLNAIVDQVEGSNKKVCDLDFNQFDEAISAHRACFGNVDIPAVPQTTHLNALADKSVLNSLSYINAAAANLESLNANSNILIIRLSLANIKEPGAETEALKLIKTAITNLRTAVEKSLNDALVITIATKSTGGRVRREVVAGSKSNEYNLAEYYSEDYPIIFNIILWFMVVFGLSLLAICYAIGSMDPGRDSIIYRMTSTRMKKDN